MMIKVFCDGCKDEIEKPENSYNVQINKRPLYKKRESFVLCYHCLAKLKNELGL